MKLASLMTGLLLLIAVQSASAQTPAAIHKSQPTEHPISMGSLTPTPEMWFYEQAMRDYADPKMQVRHKAEADAAQRRARIAAQAWYGMSKSRPTANPMPHTGGIYSPAFISNTRTPNQWSGGGSTTVVLAPRGTVW